MTSTKPSADEAQTGTLAGELLVGAEAIGVELGVPPSKVYRLIERQEIPVFTFFGNRHCTTRSALRRRVQQLLKGSSQ